MKPKKLGDLIRQINEKESHRAALFCTSSPSGTRAEGEEERSPIDQEARTVEVAFASETEEVERWYGIEVLICTPEAVDLSLLNNAAPVLDQHDRWTQVGVVDKAHVDSDHIARATLRYSRGQRGDELFQDIADRIRTKVSVGYSILEMKLVEEREDSPDVYHVTHLFSLNSHCNGL
ncbi:hypothetical protein [uncultured Microbulbifer sp.]|uniref:hypothetical protein n=1 Tax=uncultured Microbulbifer sp. TaxID=348147 RepID=UPI00261891A4|nr:hypothetical protein [uncultured Microbulbifer sp.]